MCYPLEKLCCPLLTPQGKYGSSTRKGATCTSYPGEMLRPYLWAKITLLATVPQFESHESLSSHILCPEIQIVVWRHRFISFFSLIHVTCLGKCMPSTKFIQHPWCMYSLNNAHIFEYIANESYLGLAILQVFQPVNNSIPCKFCLSCRNGHGASRSKHTYAI